jgi:hypothetical protein
MALWKVFSQRSKLIFLLLVSLVAVSSILYFGAPLIPNHQALPPKNPDPDKKPEDDTPEPEVPNPGDGDKDKNPNPPTNPSDPNVD